MLQLDAGRLRPDYIVSVGYKWLLGPFGLSFVHVAGRHRDGEPLEEELDRARRLGGLQHAHRQPRRVPARRAARPAGTRASILPALQDARCYAAVRGASLRILHVNSADVDRLGDALAHATA